MSPEIESELTAIKVYFHRKEYSSAIQMLSKLLEAYPSREDSAWLIRERASFHLLLGQSKDAASDYLYIVENLPTEIGDYFFLARTLVMEANYLTAITYLDYGLAESIRRDESYYRDSMFFLRAFALLMIRRYAEARDSLQSVSSTDKFWVGRRIEPYTKDEILMMIADEEHR